MYYFITLFLLLITSVITAQVYRVTGTVTDVKTNNYISSLSIIEEHHKIGTISNKDGKFSILLNSGKVKLVFLHEKYEILSSTFTLKNDTNIKIKLNPIIDLDKKRFFNL